MKRLTEAQSELIDAFLAEHPSRVSTAQLEKDLLISEVFPVFAQPVAYRGHDAAFVLCGGTAVSKAHRYTQRVSEDIDLRVIVPGELSRSARKQLLSHAKAEVLDRLRECGYGVTAASVKAGNENRYIAIQLTYESLYPLDQALRPELLIEISARTPILTPVVCGYDTLINEALGRADRTNRIACLHIRETIAGKNAALLRRWSARLRGAERVFELGNSRDEDVVRHIYDLACIFGHFPQEKLTEKLRGWLARSCCKMQRSSEGRIPDSGTHQSSGRGRRWRIWKQAAKPGSGTSASPQPWSMATFRPSMRRSVELNLSLARGMLPISNQGRRLIPAHGALGNWAPQQNLWASSGSGRAPSL